MIPGIHYENVSRFFAEHVPGGDVPLTFSLIAGGHSNITYRVEGGGQTWVMRRPPLGHVLPTAHDMAREFRVISGVTRAGFPAPTPIALCEDSTVNDYPFYVMDYREGHVIDFGLPEGYCETEAERAQLASALVDTLVQLHAIDYNAVGLGDFGRPDGYLERQVRRWSEQWERSKVSEVPDIDELKRRLRNALPESPAPAIVHGDYRLGNMMLDPQAPGRVVAVLDWEMSTLGDPLTDLGYTLIYWGELTDSEERLNLRPHARTTALPGFPTRRELVAEYGRKSGRNVDNIDYYQVFAYYKLAVISEGIYHRYLSGQTVGEGFDDLQRNSLPLIALALSIADASENRKLRGA